MQHRKLKNITRPPLSKQIIKRKLQKKIGGRSHPNTGIQHDSAVTKKALLLILQKWREGKTIKPSDHPQIFGIREAVGDQNNHLGWNNFVLGRWSPLCFRQMESKVAESTATILHTNKK
jgi:hypothetical protein